MRSNTPTGRRERKREVTRMQIIESSTTLFDELGYDNVTIDDITGRADVAKGTFYLHFHTKEEVACEIYNGLIRVAVEKVESEISENTSARMLLMSLFEAAAGPAVEKRRLAQVALSSAMSQVYADPEEEDDLFARTLIKIVARGQESGEVRLDWNTIDLAMLLGTIFGTTLWSWLAFSRDESLSARLSRCVATCFSGISTG